MIKGRPVAQPTKGEIAEFLRQWTGGRPSAFLDFEFNHSQDPRLNLVACSLQWASPDGELFDGVEYWLHRDKAAQERLKSDLEAMREMGTVLVGYGMAAECRSLLSLGIDPHSFDIVDLYAEWQQLIHNNKECEYGTHFSPTGAKRFSTAPSIHKHLNEGKDNEHVGSGLVAAVGQVFGIFIDSTHKTEMRNLILEDLPEYTDEQKTAIMTYCTGDIKYLPELFVVLHERLKHASRDSLNDGEIKRAQLKRGSFIASTAKMEAEGFPVNVDQIHALRDNFDVACDEIINDLVTNYYPFYVKHRKNSHSLKYTWTAKAAGFEAFLREKKLYDKWPRTRDSETGRPTNRLSTEDKVLSAYDGISEIKAFRQARKLITQLRWFKAPDALHLKRDGDFFDSIGCDNRQRVFLGPYGTQTGRNAPKASRFILAMSSWLRVLIDPPEGYKIYGIDWSSQEFALAAIMSGDKNMQKAYASGDPYLYFAKAAGAVPPDGTKAEYKAERSLFKSTTLGLQYGMGSGKLAVKLTVDTGREVTEREAEKLISLHRKTYPQYWKWLDATEREYDRHHVLKLWDGWLLLGDNDNSLSVRNFRVQGTGAVVMREAVRLAHEKGLHLLCPLHDAIYGICREDEHDEEVLGECMDKAVEKVTGGKIQVRRETGIHHHGQPWVEEKGERFLQLLGKYLEPQDTLADLEEELRNGIFAAPER